MHTNSFLKIWLLCVNFEKFTSTSVECDQSQRFKMIDRDWSHSMFIEMSFSTLTHNHQIFRKDLVCRHFHLCKDLVCRHFHLCKISVQNISCKIYASYELSNTIFIFYRILSTGHKINSATVISGNQQLHSDQWQSTAPQ